MAETFHLPCRETEGKPCLPPGRMPESAGMTAHPEGRHGASGTEKRRLPHGNRRFSLFLPDYFSMTSMVRCVLVNTQISAAMAMDSFTISEGVICVCRSSARAAERA